MQNIMQHKNDLSSKAEKINKFLVERVYIACKVLAGFVQDFDKQIQGVFKGNSRTKISIFKVL